MRKSNLTHWAYNFFISMSFLVLNESSFIFKDFGALCALEVMFFGFVSILFLSFVSICCGMTLQIICSLKTDIADGASKMFFFTMVFFMSD